ncbi:putative Permease of the major facilitator superfamily [Thiomonas delicata]|uniref:Putative Permease of the major facilitator superfamily n=1 Tax=Thiomonas delicata TaxID=364030 RepID=A0A238D5F6_THIDL|nr:putative Permease of the major facilitator superfamily [Thiomonas delicata]
MDTAQTGLARALNPPPAWRAAGVPGRQALLLGAALAGWFAVTWLVGWRQGLLWCIGVGYGLALSAAAFGFTTGWRVWITQRDPKGLWAQFVGIAVAMLVSVPLLAAHPELQGADGPLSVSLVVGAFVFGAAMQVADGCGSGTLYKAGLGHPVSLAVLPAFVFGSFLGAAQLPAWLSLGALPPVNLVHRLGADWTLATQLGGLALLALALWRFRGTRPSRWQGKAVWVAAVALGLLAAANLVVAGQPWGIVYGLGLWGAKVVQALGFDLSRNAFWGLPAQQAQLHATVLADNTSVTDLGLLFGALVAASWKGKACPDVKLPPRSWAASIAAGLLLGYSSRLAFGCNVGAYFSGIATGSLHGWVWFACAFAGSLLGVRLRRRLGMAD